MKPLSLEQTLNIIHRVAKATRPISKALWRVDWFNRILLKPLIAYIFITSLFTSYLHFFISVKTEKIIFFLPMFVLFVSIVVPLLWGAIVTFTSDLALTDLLRMPVIDSQDIRSVFAPSEIGPMLEFVVFNAAYGRPIQRATALLSPLDGKPAA